MVESTLSRTITLTGCGNFRDLGGYETFDGRRTRWRRLFRSDSLHMLTADDVASLHAEDIRVSTGFDLRTHKEVAELGIGPLYEAGARHLHWPFIPEVGDATQWRTLPPGGLGEMYLQMLDRAGECVASFFNTLAAAESYPLVFYCAAGKDRTGMTAALLLRALGVTDDQIVADYALTQALTLERLQERLRLSGLEVDPSLLLASPETMAGFLAALDQRHGTISVFLEECGVPAETLTSLRDHLLE